MMMRTNIDIDDVLLSQAMTATGLTTKRATVEEGLRTLVRLHNQTEAFSNLKGLGMGGGPGRDASGPHREDAVILVDSSVWIAHLRGERTEATAKLAAAITRVPLLIGDLILLEILQGARDDIHAARLEQELRRFIVVPLLNGELACRAAHNDRLLRAFGITIRKTADVIIATFCIEYGHALLHDDRDFAPMEAHLGLTVI